jgi:phosphonate transport system permease protein
MADAVSLAPIRPAAPSDAAWGVVRARMIRCAMIPALVLLYLAYAWGAFGVSNVLARADANRMGLMAVDSVFHKVHVEENLRRGGVSVAIEGERTATYRASEGPDWVRLGGDATVVDLADGYMVELAGPLVRFTVPDYGVIVVTVTEDGVQTELPPGPAPDWISGNDVKFDARPDFRRRVQVSRAKSEVHRYFFGWENFWFPFNNRLWGKSAGELWAIARSDQRVDPNQSNVGFMWRSFLNNPGWQHGAVFVALYETFLMALLGTMTAVLLALPLAFLAANNFTPSMAVRFAVRRVFDFVRAVDSLIWSLIFIRAFGLGPLTGSLAIAITDMGSLGKLFSEALENIDRKQVEGVESTGASRLQQYRYGVIPQLLPVLVSQSLYYLESNTRSATIIGALGAGGIGLLLVQAIGTSRTWENVTYIILLILMLVIAMDTLSGWLRQRLIEGRPERTVPEPVTAPAPAAA